jgi:hypothetical protein
MYPARKTKNASRVDIRRSQSSALKAGTNPLGRLSVFIALSLRVIL